MANLIDTSYFVNEIAVAQVDFSPVATVLTDLITKYEAFYLQAFLGPNLHKDFKAGLQEDPIAQHWLSLRDGAEFTDSAGNVLQWGGFVNEEKISPIAYYVYFYWLRKEAQITTGAGEASLQGENIVKARPIIKQVNIWNQLVEMNTTLLKFLLSDPTNYGPQKCTYLKENLLTTINELNL